MLTVENPSSKKLPRARSRRRSYDHIVSPDGRSIGDNVGIDIQVDRYRAVVFPNNIRDKRLAGGYLRLFPFSEKLPAISYIRLSKLERGEVVARVEELKQISAVLGVAPVDLILDIDAPNFNFATWFIPFAEGAATDSDDEATFAMMLAAAVRARRYSEARLTAGVMDKEYGIPAVILSRIENAHKGLSRWNEQAVANLCKLFGLGDEVELRSYVLNQYQNGVLNRSLMDIPNAADRVVRTRKRIAGLLMELKHSSSDGAVIDESHISASLRRRMVAVFGLPLPGGLIAMTPTGTEIEAPSIAGARAFGIRVGRASLGAGMPGHATVIVDPDRFPQAGGLALVRQNEDYRLLAVTIGTDGAMLGYSVSPEHEVALDGLAPEDTAAVIAAIFV